jgi:hypothetical protein
MALLRFVAVILLLFAVVPAGAFATTVERGDVGSNDAGIITIQGDNNVDAVTVSTDGSVHVITDLNGVTESDLECTAPTVTEVRCPAGTSIAATLNLGNDTFTDDRVAVPVAVRPRQRD